MTKTRKRTWALLLSAALIVTQLPAVAMAENHTPEERSIASFEELPSGVAKQTVTVGTSLSELTLPDKLAAEVYHVEENTALPDKDSGKAVAGDATSEEEIPVIWESVPPYNGDTAGTYVFTADADGYTLSSGAKPPRITVTVTESGAAPPANGQLVKTVTGWTFVNDESLNAGELALPGVSMDNQADFDAVVSMLPARISATIEGAEDPETLDVTWSCPDYRRDDDGNWPLTGDYTFTAALPAGYACEPLPTVKVVLGGISVLTINDRYTVDGLLYQETGPRTVQLIGLADSGFTGTVRVPAEIASGGKTYAVTGIGGMPLGTVGLPAWT